MKIEQIREFQNKVSEKPIISNRKVYIINDSDKMTTEAQNCLLKTLEEPPECVTIILIGSNESAFLDTIKSRCMILRFNKISDENIVKFLEENFQTKVNSQVIINLEKRDKIDTLNKAEVIYKAKEEKFEILDYINIILLDLAKKSSKYAMCINIVEDTKRRLQSNANYDMSIDNMLLKLWEQVH